MDADDMIGELSYVGHRGKLPRHVARDAATRGLNRARASAAGFNPARRVGDAVDGGPGGGMALQAPRLVPSRRGIRVSMGIVACHAVELLTPFCVTTASGQRGSLKPDRVGLARREIATGLFLAMAFRTKPDEGRARCRGRTPDGEVGVLVRDKILGC
jgi:hypothetical protein